MNTPSTDWITQLIFNNDGSLLTPHIHLCGATGSGKSTLGEYVFSLLREGLEVQTYLINPKHIVSTPDWSFPPIIKCIDDCVEGLKECQELINERLNDPSFNPTTAKKTIIVVDEWDWIYSEFGKAAVKALRPIFKVGRGVGIHLLLVGQSPLATDTGLSGSDYRNMARIILTSEAIAFLDNSQFPYEKNEYYPTAKQYHALGKRFALVVPMVGLPFVALVPHLSKPQPVFDSAQITTTTANSDNTKGFIISDSLAEPLKSLYLYCKKKQDCVTVRQIVQAKVSGLEGKSAKQIRQLLGLLADKKLGFIEEENLSDSAVVFRAY